MVFALVSLFLFQEIIIALPQHFVSQNNTIA